MNVYLIERMWQESMPHHKVEPGVWHLWQPGHKKTYRPYVAIGSARSVLTRARNEAAPKNWRPEGVLGKPLYRLVECELDEFGAEVIDGMTGGPAQGWS